LDIESLAECSSSVSIRWRDLVEVDKFHPSCVNLFEDAVARKIGNGESTTFWLQRWAGRTLLKDRFCRLFSVIIDKNAMILDILKSDGNRREWL
jgi:hypothetical protein